MADLFSQIKKSTNNKMTLFVGLKLTGADELAIEDGEDPKDFHVTLVYGKFNPNGNDEDSISVRIQSALAEIKNIIPDEIKFDAIKRFPASESSDGKDVIYAQVAPGQLEQANEELIKALKRNGIILETTFAKYNPHMTLMYIAPDKNYELKSIDTSGKISKILIGYGNEISKDNTYTIAKMDEDKHLVFGWASIAVRSDGEQITDLQGDVLDPEDLEEGAYEYVLNFRDAGEEHIPGLRKKAKLVESVVFTAEKLVAMGIPNGTVPLGWWIGFHVDDDDTWKKIKNGTYQMFSIEGKATRYPVKKADKRHYSFNEILKFNPYHDRLGRFTTGSGFIGGWNGPADRRAVTFSANPKTRAGAMAINRESGKHESIGRAYGGSVSVPDKAPKQPSKQTANKPKKPNKETEAFRKTLDHVESNNRHSQHEVATVIDKDGNIILKKGGGRSQVSFYPYEVAQMKDATLTHNHPRGSHFSKEDIQMAVKNELGEIRATAPHGPRYSFKPQEVRKDKQNFLNDFTQSYDRIQRTCKADCDAIVIPRFADGTMTVGRANILIRDMVAGKMDTWLNDNSGKYGFAYNVESFD